MAGLTEMPTIVRLDLASVLLPDHHPAASRGRSVPVFGYCILHPDGPILVDTGVGYGNEFIDELYQPDRKDLGMVLAQVGVSVTDIVAVVNSHLHFDHCGQNPLLFDGKATFLAQADEIQTVETEEHYTDRRWALAPAAQQRILRGDEPLAPGVTVLSTPGHTRGHQSVLVEGGGSRAVIGAQLVWPAEEFKAAAVDSIRRIKALQPDVVHFSHCPAHQAEFPKS